MATLSPMKVLLLDEHTAALGPKTAKFVLDLTSRVVTDFRLTTIMVTHSMRHALDLGDRTLMMHEGKLVADISGDARRRLDVADLLLCFPSTAIKRSSTILRLVEMRFQGRPPCRDTFVSRSS